MMKAHLISKSNKIHISFPNPLDDSLMEELASFIAMSYHRPVIQVSSDTLELSLRPDEIDSLLPDLFQITASVIGHKPMITVESYDDTNWEHEWKRYIKPIEVGAKFLICPSWEMCSSDSRMVISIDPGMAFGTGHHETTRLCLEWIDNLAINHKHLVQKFSFLDVGTGSGILAIAAALTGFSQVTAIDNDPEAITVAVENAEKNGVNGKIRFMVAEPAVFKNKAFDVTMANIQANVLIEMANVLVAVTSKRLVLAGILKDQEPDVRSAFNRCGALWKKTITMGEWVLIDFQTGRDDWI